MEDLYNKKSPAVKRLMREAMELCQPTEDYFAQPIESNLFEWHFTVRGPPDTPFEGGVYHGRIILPPDYPMKPPSIILLTPNGRFECHKKICLSISGHHPESWRPSWSIRTALLAIIGFMPTAGHGAIASLDYSDEERRVLAAKSQNWTCESCGVVKSLLKNDSQSPISEEEQAKRDSETREIVEQMCFKAAENAEETNSRQQQQTVEEQTTDAADNQQRHDVHQSSLPFINSRLLLFGSLCICFIGLALRRIISML